MPNLIGTGPDQVPTNAMLGRRAYMDFDPVESHPAAAPSIASATTIQPTAPITFVSGSAAISTITPPPDVSSGGGKIVLIPTGLWSTTTSGNIALATTAIVNRALVLFFDASTAKWYPTY